MFSACFLTARGTRASSLCLNYNQYVWKLFFCFDIHFSLYSVVGIFWMSSNFTPITAGVRTMSFAHLKKIKEASLVSLQKHKCGSMEHMEHSVQMVTFGRDALFLGLFNYTVHLQTAHIVLDECIEVSIYYDDLINPNSYAISSALHCSNCLNQFWKSCC